MSGKRMKRIKAFELSVLLLCVALAFVFGCGFSVETSATVYHNGKGSALLTIESELAPDAFEQSLSEYLQGFNIVSGDDDMLVAESIVQVDDGYEVRIAFRRLDKIKVNGDFYLQPWAEFVQDGSESLALLEKLDRGNLSCTVSAHYDGILGQITIPRSEDAPISPFNGAGEEIPLQAFVEEGAASSESSKILLFRLFDLDGVTRMRITVPGKLRAAGGNIRLIADDTFEVTPDQIGATVLRNKIVVDENGTQRIEPEVTSEEIPAMVGYVVFDESVNPAVYWTIGIAAAIVLGLCVAVYIHFRRAGMKILKEQARIGEGDEK